MITATGEAAVTGSGAKPSPITVMAEGQIGDGRIDKLRIQFDPKWQQNNIKSAFCVLSIRRDAGVAGERVVTTVPRQPVGLDDNERRLYGRRDGVDPAAQGLTFPLFGPGGHNFKEKSSS